MPNYNDAQGVADHLSVVMEYADRDCEFTTYPLDFEDRNGVPPQLSDWLARNAEGEKGDESAKASPVSLKAAAKEARAASEALAAHGDTAVSLEREAEDAQKASAALSGGNGDR